MAGTRSGSPNNKRSSKTEIRGALLRLRSKCTCPPDYRGSEHSKERTNVNDTRKFAAKRHFLLLGLGSKIKLVSVGRGESNASSSAKTKGLTTEYRANFLGIFVGVARRLVSFLSLLQVFRSLGRREEM